MDNSMENMLGKLQGMQAEIARVQEELGSMTATAESGGGMVKVTANGRQEIVNITIEKEVIDPTELEMLEDLIVAAVNRALAEVKALSEAKMSEAARSFLPPGIPGF
jgi:DNA-binding YbaB/EbfC family protein